MAKGVFFRGLLGKATRAFAASAPGTSGTHVSVWASGRGEKKHTRYFLLNDRLTRQFVGQPRYTRRDANGSHSRPPWFIYDQCQLASQRHHYHHVATHLTRHTAQT